MSYQKIPNNESDVETPYSLPIRQQRYPISNILNTIIKVLTCIFLILASTVLVIELTTPSSLLLLLHHHQTSNNSNTNPFTIPHTYGTKTRYMSLSPLYDPYWTPELDAHNALITLSPPLSPSPIHGALSMFHQLHCLSSIRLALQRASRGEDIGTDWTDDLHWPHCLHHLRQTILCFADDTVERGIVVNGTRTNAIDGAGDVRLCRDPRVLFEWRRRDGVEGWRGREWDLDW